MKVTLIRFYVETENILYCNNFIIKLLLLLYDKYLIKHFLFQRKVENLCENRGPVPLLLYTQDITDYKKILIIANKYITVKKKL